jgi:hypothetical protein
MKIWCFAILLCLLNFNFQEVKAIEVTPSENYSQLIQVEKEIKLLLHHFSISAVSPPPLYSAEIKPRHTWQKIYEVLRKLSMLRVKHGIVAIVPTGIEPMLDLDPRAVWEQSHRLLTEIKIFRRYLNIVGEVSPPVKYENKKPVDLFNKMNEISMNLDALNGFSINSSFVFSEVSRINEDVTEILRYNKIVDTAYPPAKNMQATPIDSLAQGFELLKTIQSIQNKLSIPTTDLNFFLKKENVNPSEVFTLILICNAELQTIKAKLGMKHAVTPFHEYYEGQSPAEVVQLIGYVNYRLSQLLKVLR